MRRNRSRLGDWMVPGALALTASLLLALPSNAFQPVHQNDQYEIRLPEFDLHYFETHRTTSGSERVAHEVSERYNGTWRVFDWNTQTDSPTNVYGSGIDYATRFATPEDAIPAARQVMEENATLLGVRNADLEVWRVPTGAGKLVVHFQQMYDGLEVWGGKSHVTFTESGRLIEFGSEFYRDIEVDATPTLSAMAAEEIARQGVPFDAMTDRLDGETTLLVLPVPTSPVRVEHHLVWRVRVRTENPVGIWVTHVDAHDGSIVWRYNDIHFLAFSGDATEGIQPATYCNGEETETSAHRNITVSGVGSTTSNVDGDWTVAYAGTDSRTVTAAMLGPYVNVQNFQGAEASFSGTATPGTPFTVAFTDANARQDERDVFDSVNDVHDFMNQVDPGYSYFNFQILANVNRPNTCNAYWDGTINFYPQGGGCANTGEIQGVVHHEFGHGIQNSLIGGQGSQGLGEGNSDVMANILTQESIIGRGFNLNCVSGIRNSKNGLKYPDAVVGQPIHSAGQVIAGFHWDIMEVYQVIYGVEAGTFESASLWHFARKLGAPTTQPSQVLWAFIADDDDGDLDNGTPNYDVICQAAVNHGFTCPAVTVGVFIDHVALDPTETEGPRDVVAEIFSTEGALNASELKVTYSINGSPEVAGTMTATGNPNEYSFTIPSLSQPSIVEYYISAADVVGNTKSSPGLAPLLKHAFDVALVWDPQESANGWTVNPGGTDNASTGVWVRVDPNGTAAQPEDDHTVNGTLCWVTGQGPVGGGLGDADVDGGTTTLQTAGYDLSGYTEALIRYWRVYSNDTGSTPGTDTWITQVRNDGGSWVDVENTQISSGGWGLIEVDVAALFGEDLGTVQLRFIASDLGSGSLVEAAIDDFEVLAGEPATTDVEDLTQGPARFALSAPQPNPMRSSTQIAYRVPTDSRVRISVFDVSGRVVRTLVDDVASAGAHVVEWNGRDNGGRPVSSGVYYYKMSSESFSATQRVILTQ